MTTHDPAATAADLQAKLAGFQTRRNDLAAQLPALDAARRDNVLAAAGGNAEAQKITEQARREAGKLTGEIADIDEAIALTTAALEDAVAREHAAEMDRAHTARVTNWKGGLEQRARAVAALDQARAQ